MSANQSVQLKVPQTEAVPLSYQVPGAQLIQLQAVYGEFDGSGASGSYLPAVEILSQDGLRMMLCPVSSSVAAGSDADATFGPFLGRAGTTQAYTTVENQGTALPQESILDFEGSGVTAADDPGNGRTTVTIPGGGGGALTLLKTLTLSAAGSIDWGNGINGNIPQTYRDLILVATCNAATGTANIAGLELLLNSNTGSAYGWNFEYNNNGSVSYGRGIFATAGPAQVGNISAPTEGIGGATAVQLELLGYSDATIPKNGWCRCGFPLESGNPRYTSGTFGYRGPAAITRVTFTSTQGNFAAGSRFDFYGRGTA